MRTLATILVSSIMLIPTVASAQYRGFRMDNRWNGSNSYSPPNDAF